MSSSLADFIDAPNGTQFLIPWKWLTLNSQKCMEVVFQMALDTDQNFSRGFAIHHLRYVNINDVKAIRYLDTRRVFIALEEIQKIVQNARYQDLPTLDDFDIVEEEPLTNVYAIYDDLIRKASNIEDLAEAILGRLEAEFALSARNREIICARVGWFNPTPETLDSIGKSFGVTRERIRQITKEYENPIINIEGSIKFFSLLEPLVRDSNSIDEFTEQAAANGLTSEEVLDLAQCNWMLRIFSPLGLVDKYNKKMEIWEKQVEIFGDNVSKISKYRSKMGFIDASFAATKMNVSIDQVLKIATQKYPRLVASNKTILARTENIVSIFESTIAKQLQLVSEVDAKTLLEGARRHGTMRSDSMSGEDQDYLNIIHELCGSPPNRAAFMSNLLYEVEFSDSDVWLINAFKSSPNGLMHRVELTRLAIETKVNLGSLNAYCGSNPMVRSHSNGVFSLIGLNPKRSEVATHAELALTQEPAVQMEIEHIGSNILFKFKPNLNLYASGVIMPSREIKQLFNGTIFKPICPCGGIESKQILKISKEGFWMGYQSILNHGLQKHEYGVSSEYEVSFDFDLWTATFLPKN